MLSKNLTLKQCSSLIETNVSRVLGSECVKIKKLRQEQQQEHCMTKPGFLGKCTLLCYAKN